MVLRWSWLAIVSIGVWCGALAMQGAEVRGEAAAGDVGWMTADELEAVFRGSVLEGKYAGGKDFVETYRASGRLSLIEPDYAIEGRWSVTGNTFCTIYDNSSSGGCFHVAQVGGNCFEFYFVARTEQHVKDEKLRKPDWTARGSVRGRDGDVCSEGVSV